MVTFDVLNNQLDLYRQVSEKEHIESWKADHILAMACYQVEDAVALGLSIHASICRRSSKDKVTVYDANVICELFRLWYSDSCKLLRVVESLQKNLFVVEGSDKFSAIVMQVGKQMAGIGKLSGQIGDILAGKMVPLKESLDGLRRTKSRGSCPDNQFVGFAGSPAGGT